MKFNTITLSDAKKLAEDEARASLQPYLKDVSLPILKDEYLEAEHCWFFFINKRITFPPEKALSWDWAYAVSKRGEVRQIVDFSEDSVKIQEYLQSMSKHFGTHE